MAKQVKKSKPRKSFGRQFLFWFIVFFIVMIPASFALDKLGHIRVFSGEDNLMKEMNTLVDPDSPFFEAFQDSQRVNVLLMGVNASLTDTIMLGSYDMKSQHVDVISIPRDTYYERPEAKSPTARKINAIYYKGGAVGTAEAVSDVLMGIPIHYYVTVEYEDVRTIVDSIGGVPVDIPFHMYYKDPTDKPPLYIDIPKGPIVLDSNNVVEFLRFRKGAPGYPGYPEGDVGRIKAQQEFIKSAFRESLGLGFPKVAKTVFSTVDSDLDLGMALKIAAKAVGLKGDDIETYLTPGKSATKDGASYWMVDETAIEEMLTTIYSIEAPEESEEAGESQ